MKGSEQLKQEMDQWLIAKELTPEKFAVALERDFPTVRNWIEGTSLPRNSGVRDIKKVFPDCPVLFWRKLDGGKYERITQ